MCSPNERNKSARRRNELQLLVRTVGATLYKGRQEVEGRVVATSELEGLRALRGDLTWVGIHTETKTTRLWDSEAANKHVACHNVY